MKKGFKYIVLMLLFLILVLPNINVTYAAYAEDAGDGFGGRASGR